MLTEDTFTLLGQIREAGHYDFVTLHRDDVDQLVIEPVRAIMEDVIAGLPEAMLHYLVTTPKNIYGRMAKNDYGKGGVWAYYWAALYPKRFRSKNDAPQLLLSINDEILEFGFFFGLNANDAADNPLLKFQRNVNLVREADILPDIIEYLCEYAPEQMFSYREVDPEQYPFSWDDYFTGIDTLTVDDLYQTPMVTLYPEEVVEKSHRELVDQVKSTFIALFPLVILASSNDPIKDIQRYVLVPEPFVPDEEPQREFPAMTQLTQHVLNEQYRKAEKAREFTQVENLDRAVALIVRRRGQKEFRDALIEAYHGRCAITGCDAVEALEAAHIVPYQGPDSSVITNGLLLRADIHTLFDLGLIAIHPENMTVVLAPALQETVYAEYDGQQLSLPEDTSYRPHTDYIRRHYEFHQYPPLS
ncbi:MAG: HNH endonuclease [Armatimonadota bacterium]